MSGAKCRSCGADIVWFKTPAGKNMPIDASTFKPGDREYVKDRHISHFATCPNADQHRKPR